MLTSQFQFLAIPVESPQFCLTRERSRDTRRPIHRFFIYQIVATDTSQSSEKPRDICLLLSTLQYKHKGYTSACCSQSQSLQLVPNTTARLYPVRNPKISKSKTRRRDGCNRMKEQISQARILLPSLVSWMLDYGIHRRNAMEYDIYIAKTSKLEVLPDNSSALPVNCDYFNPCDSGRRKITITEVLQKPPRK